MRKISLTDQDQTFLRIDSTTETPKMYKYQSIWKRAIRKIKTGLIISRFMNLARSNPYTVTEEILECYIEDSIIKVLAYQRTISYTNTVKFI